MGAVPEMGVRDQADLLKQLEGAVHGGDVDADRGLLDLGVDLLWSRVLQLGHRFEHELALRSHPVATRPQRVIPRLRHEPDSSGAQELAGRGGQTGAASPNNPLAHGPHRLT